MVAYVPEYKSIFISDTHLGSRGAQAHHLNNFLQKYNSENLFLVGDIVDGWRLERKFFWPEQHTKVLEQINKKALSGTHVHYLIGNHDESVKNFSDRGLNIAELDTLAENVNFETQIDYIGIDGKKYLVCHGDMFDTLMDSNTGRWVMFLGTTSYDLLLYINTAVNIITRKLNLPYINITGFAKRRAKAACNLLLKFEGILSNHASEKQYDGVICGHIHTPEIKNISGTVYMNSGDWVENCSALVEHHDGSWEIINWRESHSKTKTSTDN